MTLILPELYKAHELYVLNAWKARETGAEELVVKEFSSQIRRDGTASPEIQKAVSEILAEGRWPPRKKRGRKPKSGDVSIATYVSAFVDVGFSRNQAIAHAAEEFHKDERTIRRILAKQNPTPVIESRKIPADVIRMLFVEYPKVRLRYSLKAIEIKKHGL